ncbi:hypothetical protein CCHL11_03260 [Colletotrichum chlorophyti]|uniref:Rhodopsin domain-containing protein n=1 Tax=Colletotrichum chlorophyti TaxID=708187 RepID=A0A1Q8S487_9PEZI|nr:hypothetical protein CCHL11_03260 [Colletotrichum chlorophyti]
MASRLLVRERDVAPETQQLAAAVDIDHTLDDESRVAEIVAILVVGSVLSTLAVGLRAFTRVKMLRTFGADDSVMVVAQLLTIGSAVAIGLESKYGLGSHSWVPPPEDYVPYMKSFYSSIIVYNIATCLVKISILLQYRRIFANDRMQKLTLLCLFILSTYTVTLSVLLPLMCYPVAAFWDSTVEGQCLDYLTIWYAMAGINLVADVVIFSLPIPVINSLQLPRRQKRMLLLVFGLGFFTCIISALRIRTLRVAAKTKDPYWDNVNAATWSFLEVTVGILAACLPTIRPIFVTLLPSLFATTSLNSKSGARPRTPFPSADVRGAQTLALSTCGDRLRRPSDSTEGLKDCDDAEVRGQDTRSPTGEYTVSVSAGAPEGHASWLRGGRDRNERQGRGHIRTTTVVTQEIAFEALSRDSSGS